ncbi:MAG TPA: hypothetical protein VID75_04555 [Acidimicrobiales bacterium]|jgi:hypothetical protein
MPKTPKIAIGLAVATGSLLGALVNGPVAGAGASTPIETNQLFVGLVNGKQSKATIDVLCPGPSTTGHALANQTVAVSRAPSTAASTGFTGSRGRSVVAVFGGPAANASVSFATYGSRPIPTSLILPCAGTGTVVFSPHPTSKTARNSTVPVTYLNLGVSPGAGLPAPTPGRSRTVTVTEADNGRSITLHRGDRLDVTLAGRGGFTWTEPVSSNQAVLRRKAGSPGPTASATFLALSTGKAIVSAEDNPNCYPLCKIASRPFDVDVSVTG